MLVRLVSSLALWALLASLLACSAADFGGSDDKVQAPAGSGSKERIDRTDRKDTGKGPVDERTDDANAHPNGATGTGGGSNTPQGETDLAMSDCQSGGGIWTGGGCVTCAQGQSFDETAQACVTGDGANAGGGQPQSNGDGLKVAGSLIPLIGEIVGKLPKPDPNRPSDPNDGTQDQPNFGDCGC